MATTVTVQKPFPWWIPVGGVVTLAVVGTVIYFVLRGTKVNVSVEKRGIGVRGLAGFRSKSLGCGCGG